MKKLLLPVLHASLCMLLLSPVAGFAQGWVAPSGGGGNVLTPYNGALGLSPMSIGIGTATPSEQLHTTAGVLFAGLTLNNNAPRVLVQDASGKLFYSTSAGGNFWSLTGNGGTTPGTAFGQNFLGTTDPTRLVIGTNKGERMTVLPNGNVGVNTSVPTNKMEVI